MLILNRFRPLVKVEPGFIPAACGKARDEPKASARPTLMKVPAIQDPDLRAAVEHFDASRYGLTTASSREGPAGGGKKSPLLQSNPV